MRLINTATDEIFDLTADAKALYYECLKLYEQLKETEEFIESGLLREEVLEYFQNEYSNKIEDFITALDCDVISLTEFYDITNFEKYIEE